MRIEKVVVDLVNTSLSSDANAEKLSRLLELTLRKVGSSGEAGAQALRIVQAKFVRDALTQDLNIKRLRARQTPYLSKPASPPPAPMTPPAITHSPSLASRESTKVTPVQEPPKRRGRKPKYAVSK